MMIDVVNQLVSALGDYKSELAHNAVKGPLYPSVSGGRFTLSDTDTDLRFKVTDNLFTIDNADGTHVAWVPSVTLASEDINRFVLRPEGESGTLPTLPEPTVYGLDAPVNLDTVNIPALIVTPIRTATQMQARQNTWNSLHTIGIEYATDEVDEDTWRQQAMDWSEAVLQFFDRLNANEPSYVGTSDVIHVTDWSVDYAVTWRDPPNALRGFSMEVDILARDILN